MAHAHSGGRRIWISMALVSPAILVGLGQGPALADTTSVRGSAYGYYASVSLLGGPAGQRGPGPAATLPAGGSAGPVTGVAATGSAVYGPATIFSSGPLNASTHGTAGPAGSVTSFASVTGVNTSGDEVFTAAHVTSSCFASQSSGNTGSTAITDGTLRTSEGDPNVEGDDTVVPVPANPEANTTIEGEIEGVGDSFRYVFNEQIVNEDGSITVNAAHQYLLGPTAVGELVVGQSTCGMAPTTRPDEPPSATTGAVADGPKPAAGPAGSAPAAGPAGAAPAGPAAVSSNAPAKRAASLPATAERAVSLPAALPTQAAGVTGPGAFGYTSKVGLFGGPAETRPCADPPANKTDCRPRPAVALPSGGSTTPVTDNVPTAEAKYGPGFIFTSGPITVSTQGTTASSTSKVDIQNVNTSDQEVFTATSLASTCTGSTGSTTIASGNTLRTSEGANLDSDTDDTNVEIPASPPPNTVREGKIETVGDNYRIVFNEQIVKDGSITVNAIHMFLLGPTAIGELTVGQSRCGANAVSTSGPPPPGANTPGANRPGANTAGTSSPRAGAATGAGAGRTGPGMATTGFGALGPLLLALTLLALGTAASVGGARLRSIRREAPLLPDLTRAGGALPGALARAPAPLSAAERPWAALRGHL